jgi:protein-L-isoaspartate O-methyltransferase
MAARVGRYGPYNAIVVTAAAPAIPGAGARAPSEAAWCCRWATVNQTLQRVRRENDTCSIEQLPVVFVRLWTAWLRRRMIRCPTSR